MQSLIQIFKVNEVKKGTSKKTGNAYEIQDCECALLSPEGQIDQVGVLTLPKELSGKVVPGIFMGSFAMKVDFQTRHIGAVLTGLNALPPKAASAPAAKAS